MALMEFRPPERRVAKAPVGAFSSLVGHRLELFKQGEEITENAKEVFGLLEVGKDDQGLRNTIAESLNTDLDELLDKYSGGYESLQFQRDAKKIIRDYAGHEALPRMKETMEEIKFEENLRRESARNPSLQLYDFNPSKERATTYTPETGYSAYKTGLETAQNHLKDAQDHLGNLIPNMGELKPGMHVLKTQGMRDLDMVRTGTWKGITDKRIKNRALQVVDNFADSMQGGNQMARRFAFEQGIPLKDDQGNYTEEVRAFLADYLYEVGADQRHEQVNTRYSFPPAYTQANKEKSIFGSAVTNAALHNNPEADKFRKLETSDLTGQGLQGTAAARLADLTAKKFPTTRFGQNVIELTEDEEKERKRLSEIDTRLKDADGLTGYLRGFKKEDGTLDMTTLDDTHRGLYTAYKSVIDELEISEEDAIGGGISDPTLLNSTLDDRVLTRYNGLVERSMVAVGKGYNLSKNDVDQFKRNFIGDVATAGLGRITEMGLIDPDGEETNIRSEAEKAGFDLTDTESAKKFKQSIQLKQNLIPLISNGIAQVDIAGKTYTLTSDEFAKKAKADNLSAVSPVLLGNVTESEPVQLSFLGGLTGKFEADHTWNDDDSYSGNGVIFTFEDNGVEKFFNLEEIIQTYLLTSNFYNVGK